MATITAQVLIGDSHAGHGGIMNASAIYFYEKSTYNLLISYNPDNIES